MIQKFLREIAFMTMLVVVGAVDFLLGLFAPKWWLLAMDAFLAILAFFMAWLRYRDARTISRWIDTEMDSLRKQNMCLRDAIIELRRAQPDEHEDAGCPV